MASNKRLLSPAAHALSPSITVLLCAQTMRLIAERLLPPAAAGTTYVDREIVNIKLAPLGRPSAEHHLYCSGLNPGASALLAELSQARGYELALKRRGSHARKRKPDPVNTLRVTASVEDISNCDHMLLYLTGQTWTRGKASSDLAVECMQALDHQVHVLLVHEMVGCGRQAERHGCEFGIFFAHPDGATPPELLKRGIYSEIAVPLKGGPWREASMAMLANILIVDKADLNKAMTIDTLVPMISRTSAMRGMRRLVSRATCEPGMRLVTGARGSRVARVLATSSCTSAAPVSACHHVGASEQTRPPADHGKRESEVAIDI